MKITSVEAVPLAVSFRSTFRFGTTDRSTSPNVVVVIRTDDGVVGYGEACPVPAFTGETQNGIVELVEQRIAPALHSKDPVNRVALLAELAKVVRFAPFTIAAVDTALLDLVGRATGVPVYALLGGAFRTRTEAHGSVGWDEDPAKMAALAVEQAQTYRWLKLYAGRGEIGADLDRLTAVRDAVGPDVRLFVDINGMWTPSNLLTALPRVHDIGLELLEQPLPPSAAAFQAALVDRLDVAVAADESVRTPADAATVVAQRSATVINLGHAKLGGPTAAMHAAQIALGSGIDVMVGSVIEMGLSNAMGLHVAAALPRLAFPSYLMGPLKYREQITHEQVEVIDGHIAIPDGPGLGVTVDEQELARLDARRR